MPFKSYTTVVSSEAVTLYSSRTHEFLPGFWWSWRSLVFNVLFCRPLFVCLFFLFWPLSCLSFFGLRPLITSLVSSKFSCPFCYFSLSHCFLSPSLAYDFWLPICYLQTFRRSHFPNYVKYGKCVYYDKVVPIFHFIHSMDRYTYPSKIWYWINMVKQRGKTSCE